MRRTSYRMRMYRRSVIKSYLPGIIINTALICAAIYIITTI